MNEAHAAIGILQGIEDNEGVGERGGDGGLIAGGKEMIGGEQARVGAADFVAMDSVTEPDDGGSVGDEALGVGFGGLAGVEEFFHRRLNFRQAAHVGLAADDGVNEFAALPAFAVFDDFEAIRRGGGKGFEVAN